LGGDVLTWGEASLIRELAPNATIGCFYGATETQRAVGYYEIPADLNVPASGGIRPVPLGRGIDDVQLLILNKNGNLAGVGELGELYVRSPHLAQGYIGDTNLTAQRFITNPFNNDPEDRLYRTGELARYLPDGNVEWSGRNDRRVNIRGFRVELEEIETVLKEHPAVNDAAVVLRDHELVAPEDTKPETRNPKLEQRLIAYVVSDEEASESLNDLLHSFLSSQLPDYMLPAEFVILNRLPLSPNGKIDYNALPPPTRLATPGHGEPRTFTERELAKIFADVLCHEKIGIDDNFFRLGGHSLLAAQAAARIRTVLGVSLDLRTFLEAPTVAALAKQLTDRLQAESSMPGGGELGREEIEL
jgi:acyl-coenzyme A synthetase/AMP-(fatty) acid ligase